MNLVFNLDHNRTISYVGSLLVFSTFLYDYNEVKVGFDLLHISMKLLTVFVILVFPKLFDLSDEATAYNFCISLYVHCAFSTMYVDSGYSNGFNQAFCLLLITSANKIMRYYYHLIIFGFVLSVISLYYGAGFSFIEKLSGNPMNNYVHVSLIYAVMSIVAYEIIVKRSSLKFQEISRFAGIGLKSSYLMHEMKNISNARNNGQLTDILSCIDLIVSGKVQSEKLNLKIVLTDILGTYSYRLRKEGIRVESDIELVYVFADMKSIEIILVNLLTNSIEHLEEHEENKVVSIILKNKKLVISNTFTLSQDIALFDELKYSTKSPITNKGIGLSVVRELASLNNVKFTTYLDSNTYNSELCFK